MKYLPEINKAISVVLLVVTLLGGFVSQVQAQDVSSVGIATYMQVDGTVGLLEEPMIHENYQSISQYLQKMDVYTESEANAYISQNAHFAWVDAVRIPVRDFLKTFFLQEG